MASIVPDASFLLHALLPSQQTVPAQTAFAPALMDDDSNWVILSFVYLEFASVLRKHTTRRTLDGIESERLFRAIRNLPALLYDATPELLDRAWEIAVQSQQSDIFDSFGLAVAEEVDAEFWTSDLRFVNATATFAADRVKYIS